jgi:dephospho-CoA kinase
MFSVGLTGGIASGKTTISNLFSQHKVPVIDTDVISRELLEPGEEAFKQAVEHYGIDLLNDAGSIDRVKLRQIVFSSKVEKKWLETMLHPLIYHRSYEAILENSTADYVLLVVPLLLETNFQSLVDRILVVDCPAEIQIDRLLKRDNIDSELAHKMLSQQLSNVERLARAHDIIDNQLGKSALESQVDKLHRHFLALSRA